MKKIIMLTALLILMIIIIIGCSSQKSNIHNRQGFLRNQNMSSGQWSGRNLNLTEEERQKLFEERQQKAIESCRDKNEGDKCLFENPQGEIEGKCKTIDNKLVCTPDRPMRQR